MNDYDRPTDRLPSLDNNDQLVADFEDTPQQEERSADFGESGQFAPGGYYNQRGAGKADRLDLDEELAPRRH